MILSSRIRLGLLCAFTPAIIIFMVSALGHMLDQAVQGRFNWAGFWMAWSNAGFASVGGLIVLVMFEKRIKKLPD
jgi:hypothetical protein